MPPELIRRTEFGPSDNLIWVRDLQGLLTQCFAQGLMPAELGGVSWAVPGTAVNVRGYNRYPSRHE